ncbi:MAG: hypothetical protein COV66_04510 [Nitrospinae bacterium CG11_big_fil_rev_8_21_14_0_20_45_15]|nr:MAG: hypothetical protein COV66_04510 [Nitrospinae bacterium CG11_big_fil_rev_8_21_14_0_20_45_15]
MNPMLNIDLSIESIWFYILQKKAPKIPQIIKINRGIKPFYHKEFLSLTPILSKKKHFRLDSWLVFF